MGAATDWIARGLGLGAVLATLPLPQAEASMGLEFECAQYAAPAYAGLVELRVVLDGDTAVDGLQPVPHGLFSYGFVVRFDGAKLHPIPQGAIQVDPSLAYSGFARGALISQGQDFIAAKGNIDPIGDFYGGTQLAIVRLQAVGAPDPSTPLMIEILEQSPSEAVFVDGTGSEIDPLISFRPSTLALLEPLRVEWIPGAFPPGPHARLSFGVHPAFDFDLESSDSLKPGDWQRLPGAPHNSGEWLDFAITDHRFYRLALFKR